jgi:hypothetical protein
VCVPLALLGVVWGITILLQSCDQLCRPLTPSPIQQGASQGPRDVGPRAAHQAVGHAAGTHRPSVHRICPSEPLTDTHACLHIHPHSHTHTTYRCHPSSTRPSRRSRTRLPRTRPTWTGTPSDTYVHNLRTYNVRVARPSRSDVFVVDLLVEPTLASHRLTARPHTSSRTGTRAHPGGRVPGAGHPLRWHRVQGGGRCHQRRRQVCVYVCVFGEMWLL